MYVNGLKIHPFKAKDSEIKLYQLRFRNISNDFVFDNMIKTGLNRVYYFSVSCEKVDISDIADISKYLIKKKHNVV